jgi:hypothetical protein
MPDSKGVRQVKALDYKGLFMKCANSSFIFDRKSHNYPAHVIPAKAGISWVRPCKIPAFAGMTTELNLQNRKIPAQNNFA